MRITDVSKTCFILDGYYIDTVVIKRNIRNSSLDIHDKNNFIGLMKMIMENLYNKPERWNKETYVVHIITVLNRLKIAKIFYWNNSTG